MAALGIPHMRLTVRQVRDGWPLVESQVLAALRNSPYSGGRVTGVTEALSRADIRHSNHADS
jgi:hypothetical protein